MHDRSASRRYALATIALWSTLAALGVSLSHLPPFLLTGLALVLGCLPGLFRLHEWRVPPATLALGVYGLFGYHLLLFIALGSAPPVEANLVNYLWPLLIVILSPLVLPGTRLTLRHGIAALMGFSGAAIAILSSGGARGELSWGFVPAAGAALVWSTYSLATRRVAPFPTAAVGLFCLVSGLFSLACHALFEPPVALTPRDLVLVAVVGLGPLGIAFYTWDRALKLGDAREIGILAYITPLASTLILMAVSGRGPSAAVGLAAALIIGAAVIGMRAK